MNWPPPRYGGTPPSGSGNRAPGNRANPAANAGGPPNRPVTGTYRDYLLARNANSVFSGYLTGGNEPSAPSLSLGERVVWLQDEGAAELGSVRWIGRLPTLEPNDWSVGVEFDRPIGNGNGRFAGKQYFIARSNHALFMPIMTLMKAEEFFGGRRYLPSRSFEPSGHQPSAYTRSSGHVPSHRPTQEKSNLTLERPTASLCGAGGAVSSASCLCPVHSPVTGPLGEGQRCFLTSTPRGQRHQTLTVRSGGHKVKEWSDEEFSCQSWNSSQSVVSCPPSLGPGAILMEVTSDSSDSDASKGKFRTLMACFLPGMSRKKKGKKRKQKKRKKFVVATQQPQPQKHYSLVSSPVDGSGLRGSESFTAFASAPQCRIHSCSPEDPRQNVSCSYLDNFSTRHRCDCDAGRKPSDYRFSSPDSEKAEKVRFSSSESERPERVRFLSADPVSMTRLKKKKKAPPPPRPESPLGPKPLVSAFPGAARSSVSLGNNRTVSTNSLPMRDPSGNPVTRSYLAKMDSAQSTIPRTKVRPEDDPNNTGNLVLIGNQRPLNKLYQTKSLSALQKTERQKHPANTSSSQDLNKTGESLPSISPHPRRRTSKKKAPMPPPQQDQDGAGTSGSLSVPHLTVTSPELSRSESNKSEPSRALDVSTDDDRVESPTRPVLPKKTVSHDSLTLFGYSSESLKKKELLESKHAREIEKANLLKEEENKKIEVQKVTAQQTPKSLTEVESAANTKKNKDLSLPRNTTVDAKTKPLSPKPAAKTESKECQTAADSQEAKIDKPSKISGKIGETSKQEEGLTKTKKSKTDNPMKEHKQVKEILNEIEDVVNSNPTVRDFVTAFNKFTEKAEKIAADLNVEVENMNPQPKPDTSKKITIKQQEQTAAAKPVSKATGAILKSHRTKWTFNQSQNDRHLNISFAEADQILKENELKQQEFEKNVLTNGTASHEEVEDKITNRKKSSKKFAAPHAPDTSSTDPPSTAGSSKLNNLDAGSSTSHRYTTGVYRGAVGLQHAAPPFSQNRDALRQLAVFQRYHRMAISVGDLTSVNGTANDQPDPKKWAGFKPRTPEMQARNGGNSCVGKPPLPLRALELAGGSPALFAELEQAIARGDHKRAAALARELALHKVLSAKPKRNSQLSRKPNDEPLVTVSLYIEDKDTHQGPVPLTIYPSMTVALLKEKVERDLGFLVRSQRWILGQTFVVDEKRTLGSLDVCAPGCPIFLYIVQKKALDDEEEEDIAFEEETKKANNKVQETVLPADESPQAASLNRSPLLLEAHLETLLEEAAGDQSAVAVAEDVDTSSENSITGGVDVWSAGSPDFVSFTPTDADDEEDEEVVLATLPDNTPEPTAEVWSEEKPDSRPPSRPPSAVARMSYDKLVALEDQDLIANAEVFECPVCFLNVYPGEGVVLRECLHLFCRECLIRAVEYCEEAMTKCPFMNEEYSCDSHLLEREIKALVPPEVFEKHLQRSVAAAESRAENSFHCKSADCPGWCLFEDNVNAFACPVCARVNCLTCAAIHEGKDCRQYQDELDYESAQSEDARKTKEYLDSMVAEGKAMHCPTCRVIVMKKWGCDWLKCSVCTTEICWVTKGPRWGPAGRGDTSGGCQCMVNKVRCHPACNYCH